MEQDWTYILHNASTGGVWDSSHDGYLGFRTDTTGGSYGWVRYSYTRSDGVSTMTLYDAAYETVADADIMAGAVPEPTTLALLCLGALGLLAQRRRAWPNVIDS